MEPKYQAHESSSTLRWIKALCLFVTTTIYTPNELAFIVFTTKVEKPKHKQSTIPREIEFWVQIKLNPKQGRNETNAIILTLILLPLVDFMP